MNDHKFNKSNIHNDSRSTINDMDRQFIKKCQTDREGIESLERTKRSIESKIVELERVKVTDHDFSTQFDKRTRLAQELRQIKYEIQNLQENSSEIDYLFKMGKFMESKPPDPEHTQTSSPHWNKVSVSCAGSQYSGYMEHCFGATSNTSQDEEIFSCRDCKSNMLYDEHKATLSCTECGLCINYQDPKDTSYREGICIVTPYAYKRINHFKEWLAQIQAKETTEIPENVISDIFLELKKERITDGKLITPEKIRRYLKKLRYNKFYEHIPCILNKITGKKAPKFSNEIEEELIKMFSVIQEPFQKHSKIIAPKRKNFLSYSYTLRQMCIILKHEELAQNFALLKSREKNFVQDQIWKAICQDVGWPFYKSV